MIQSLDEVLSGGLKGKNGRILFLPMDMTNDCSTSVSQIIILEYFSKTELTILVNVKESFFKSMR